MDDVITTAYDGCGMCFVGVRRLSRKTDATNSPGKQMSQILAAVSDVGGHIIAWADDWEVSGAIDPMTRPAFGPWLRGEMGPYDGIASAAVDRVGRNVRDALNTQHLLTSQGRMIVTADHPGIWIFPDQENDWMIKAWSSQLELRAIQKRNNDETTRARQDGDPKQKPSYGYQYIRLVPMGKVDHVAIDEIAAEIIRDVARRILTDMTGKITCATEAARLNRLGVPSPSDRRAQLYGRPLKGNPWTAKSVRSILISEAALGYLMHGGRPVIGRDGRPVRLADPLWDRATHDALLIKTAPKQTGAPRAPKSTRLLSGGSWCGNCGHRLYVAGRSRELAYGCTARVRGIRAAADCKPAPSMTISVLNDIVEDWYLARYGAAKEMREIYDPGTGYASQIAALEADRKRLRVDRAAGLYDEPDDAEWYQTEYKRMGEEIKELKDRPERAPGLRKVETGRTIADAWAAAPDDAARREMLNAHAVRVVLFPETAEKRYVITGITPYEMAA